MNVINFLTVAVVNKIWRKVREKFLFNFLKTPLTLGFIGALNVLTVKLRATESSLTARDETFSQDI